MKGLLDWSLIPQSLYAQDVADMAGDCLRRYGPEEWRAVVLTNEIHGHLGIYSTLGAKMGILARELFEAQGLEDDISVLSFAGSIPPVSCLNDGLQVSTGASMGHGLFAVSSGRKACSAEARFTCGSVTLDISLKPAFEESIRSDIRQGVALYGHGPRYWDYIRSLALKYWLEWDRRQIYAVSANKM